MNVIFITGVLIIWMAIPNVICFSYDLADIVHPPHKQVYYLIPPKAALRARPPFSVRPKPRLNHTMTIVRKERRKKEKFDNEWARKKNALNLFMTHSWHSTNYLFEEMLRINRTNKIKDGARRMLDYLDRPENAGMKRKVMECYVALRKQKMRERDTWKYAPNNWLIHVLRDPYNDGVLN